MVEFAKHGGILKYMFDDFQVDNTSSWEVHKHDKTQQAWQNDYGFPPHLHHIVVFYHAYTPLKNVGVYSRTCLKQYRWDQGVGIELERLLN